MIKLRVSIFDRNNGQLVKDLCPDIVGILDRLKAVQNQWADLEQKRAAIITNIQDTTIEELNVSRKYTIETKKKLIFEMVELVKQYGALEIKWNEAALNHNNDKKKKLEDRKAAILEGFKNSGWDDFKISMHHPWAEDKEYRAIEAIMDALPPIGNMGIDPEKMGYPRGTSLIQIECAEALKKLGEMWISLEN